MDTIYPGIPYDLFKKHVWKHDIVRLGTISSGTMQGSELLGKIVGIPGCQVRIAHLKCGSNALELFEYKVPEGKLIPEDRIHADKGFIHIGFRSDNVRQEYEKLKKQGVRFISEPVEF